jgi:hypothetical protein
MDDKILNVKKEMKKIIKSNGITRLDKYNLLKQKSNTLSEIERKLLLNECKRDYESYERIKDIKEIITVFLTGLGLILTIANVYFKDTYVFTQFEELLILVATYVVFSIIILSLTQNYRGRGMDISKQMIDILEEK